jgi:hypothetical protein
VYGERGDGGAGGEAGYGGTLTIFLFHRTHAIQYPHTDSTCQHRRSTPPAPAATPLPSPPTHPAAARLSEPPRQPPLPDPRPQRQPLLPAVEAAEAVRWRSTLSVVGVGGLVVRLVL